jgi:hypothetical protein
MSRVERKTGSKFHAFFNTLTPVYSPKDWDLACEYAISLCDPAKFAPLEFETFYPEDVRYMDLRNAFLAGMVHSRQQASEGEKA